MRVSKAFPFLFGLAAVVLVSALAYHSLFSTTNVADDDDAGGIREVKVGARQLVTALRTSDTHALVAGSSYGTGRTSLDLGVQPLPNKNRTVSRDQSSSEGGRRVLRVPNVGSPVRQYYRNASVDAFHGMANGWKSLPSYALWVRTLSSEEEKLRTILVESMRLFWPNGYGRLVVVLDDEKPAEHAWGANISAQYPFPQVVYEKLPEDPATFPGGICGRGQGYDRQQWSRFWADQHTDAEVIGFLDNDSLFVSVVTPESLFKNGKPIVIGKHTPFRKSRWSLATQKAICQAQVADFMYSFPIMIKRSVLPKLRDHMVQCTQTKSFAEAFRMIASINDPSTGSYGEFNIILNYMWYYLHDEYDWHIQAVQVSNGPFADGTHNRPVPRIATHARGLTSRNISYYLRQGYCFSCVASQNCLYKPSEELLTAYETLKHYIMFNWEHTGHMWMERKLGDECHPRFMQAAHYRNVAKLGHQWPESIEFILRKNESFYPDCSVPPDRTGCKEYNQRQHIRGLQRTQVWQWEHGQERMKAFCSQLMGFEWK